MNRQTSAAEVAGRGIFGQSGDALRRQALVSSWPGAQTHLHRRLWGIGLLGGLAAAGLAYLTSENAMAGPSHVAVILRVLIIVTLIATGMYAQTTGMQARMGALLVVAGFFSVLWLLNGAGGRLAFSVGMLCGGAAPTVFCYLMLAYPSGSLHASSERRLLAITGGALMLFWALLMLTSAQPPFKTPVVRCTPHCPGNAFFLGSTAAGAVTALKVAILLSWSAMGCGTAALIARRLRQASTPLRRLLVPVGLAAGAYVLCLLAYFIAWAANSSLATAFGAAYVELAVVIPLAILIGLAQERLFMGQALADFVTELVRTPGADAQTLMARALKDPSLDISYRRPTNGAHVDRSGSPAALPERDSGRAVAWIERDRAPIAAVVFDSRLADQARFVQAAGAVATLRLEHAQLEAELKASNRELSASRIRLVEAADAERQRIERDLHDGIQQQLVGLRIKVDLAAEAVKEEPARGGQMIASIGEQMDDLLEALRALARGIYPSLLTEWGLEEALKSIARRAPAPVSVRASGIGRYAEDVEVAVYYCCLEALQNVAKHAGRDASATARLWRAGRWLTFEVRDSGLGFDPEDVHSANGLVNMRDRIEAVGGHLTVHSTRGQGTAVRGRVPIVWDSFSKAQ